MKDIEYDLDKAVAKAIGKPWHKPTHGNCCTCQVCGWDHDNCQCGYSDDWSQAGPLIEEHKMGIWFEGEDWGACCGEVCNKTTEYGDTPLIAAMRALVKSKEKE